MGSLIQRSCYEKKIQRNCSQGKTKQKKERVQKREEEYKRKKEYKKEKEYKREEEYNREQI